MSITELSKEEIYKKEEEVKKGAGWFFWIAFLSIINSLIVALNGNLNFIIGLGITQIIDAIVMFPEPGGFNIDKTTGLSLDLIITSVFFLFGYYAKQKKSWAFIVGMVLYGLDGLIFLPFQDFWGFGFHVFALIMIFKGFQAVLVLNKIDVPLIEVNKSAALDTSPTDSSLFSKQQVTYLECPSCGSELNEKFKYCSSCGMRIPE